MNTYGLLPDVVEHVRSDIEGLALDLVCPTSVVPDATDDGTDVTPGHADGLAIVEGLDGGQQVEVLLGEVGELEQQDAALVRGGLAPRSLEGLAGGGDGEVDVLLGSLAHGADDLLCCGVDDLEGLLVDGLYPLVVDEPGNTEVLVG